MNKPINHIEEAQRLGQIAKDKAVEPTELIHGTADAAKRATGEVMRYKRNNRYTKPAGRHRWTCINCGQHRFTKYFYSDPARCGKCGGKTELTKKPSY